MAVDTYDLILQHPAPGQALDLLLARSALEAQGLALDGDGRGAWSLPEGQVEARPLHEGGALLGLEVRVPLRDSPALLEAVVKRLVEVATPEVARLVDPQRQATVSLASLGSTVDSYLQVARYAGEYGGVSAALGLSTLGQPVEEDSSALRWLLALAVFLVALYAAWRTATVLRARPDEAPAPVDGPSEVRRQ